MVSSHRDGRAYWFFCVACTVVPIWLFYVHDRPSRCPPPPPRPRLLALLQRNRPPPLLPLQGRDPYRERLYPPLRYPVNLALAHRKPHLLAQDTPLLWRQKSPHGCYPPGAWHRVRPGAPVC